MSLRKRLSAIVSSPLVQLALGLAMMACGVAELVGEIGEGLAGEGGPRGAHGVVLFGLLHGVKSVLELIEGLERVEAADRADGGASLAAAPSGTGTGTGLQVGP